MGIPLKEQLNNPHPKADRECPGCHGSGWLACLVADRDRLDEAGVKNPTDFLFKCDECEVFEDDEDAVVAARTAGMKVEDSGRVLYTVEQLLFTSEPD